MTPRPVIFVEYRRNIAALEHPWSTIISIALFPWLGERPVIKSMAIV